MTETFVIAGALILSVAFGLWLYRRFSTGSDLAVATFGLIRNGSTFIIGVFLLMTGMWPLVILGGFLIILAVFLGSAHASNLDETTSLRKRIAG